MPGKAWLFTATDLAALLFTGNCKAGRQCPDLHPSNVHVQADFRADAPHYRVTGSSGGNWGRPQSPLPPRGHSPRRGGHSQHPDEHRDLDRRAQGRGGGTDTGRPPDDHPRNRGDSWDWEMDSEERARRKEREARARAIEDERLREEQEARERERARNSRGGGREGDRERRGTPPTPTSPARSSGQCDNSPGVVPGGIFAYCIPLFLLSLRKVLLPPLILSRSRACNRLASARRLRAVLLQSLALH